jgi:hypothetical protein
VVLQQNYSDPSYEIALVLKIKMDLLDSTYTEIPVKRITLR